jgi:hypothetical protein
MQIRDLMAHPGLGARVHSAERENKIYKNVCRVVGLLRGPL